MVGAFATGFRHVIQNSSHDKACPQVLDNPIPRIKAVASGSLERKIARSKAGVAAVAQRHLPLTRCGLWEFKRQNYKDNRKDDRNKKNNDIGNKDGKDKHT